MKSLTTTALALVLAAPMAFADNHSTSTETESASASGQPQLIRTRDITGGAVYTSDAADWELTQQAESIESDWEQIGEIEDIVLSESGELKGVVVEVGGFLDIGDKHVMIEVQDMDLVPVDDATYSIVTRLSEEQLEEMPAVDEAFWD